jgi:hypothetical protein
LECDGGDAEELLLRCCDYKSGRAKGAIQHYSRGVPRRRSATAEQRSRGDHRDSGHR